MSFGNVNLPKTPSPVILPVAPSIAFYTERIQLDGVLYTIQYRWNQRMGHWVQNVQDANGNDLIDGILQLTDYPLGYKGIGTIQGYPPGVQMIVDESGAGLTADRKTFGSGVNPYYFQATT
jgi:hypothetical protein